MTPFHPSLMLGHCRLIKMRLLDDMRHTITRCILTCFLTCMLCQTAALGDAPEPPPPPEPPAAPVQHFAVFVRGYWNGAGDASVSGGTVQITASVRDDAGRTGTLTATDLKVADNNYFSGTGTCFGLPMTINGRVDAADPTKAKGKGKGKGKKESDDSVLINARIVATFSAGTHTGRVAGGGN